MKNSGFKELYGYENVPARVTRDKYGKDEIETVSFFLERLKQSAGKPFLAVYYSFIAHWPYVDFGEQYRIFPNIENRLCRYYNNLYLMDTQIKRIYEFLEQAGILEKTIIIIVGDHGEAFNQHNGNWVHSRASYNENYMVPALIYQPGIFTPRRITVPTTHADILPTLLDATGIQYNEKLIQGESLLSGKLKRKYVFLFGNENTISSISMNKIKVQYSFKDNRGWAFDLNKDPRENNPLPFEEYNEQREVMMYYYEYQDHVLAAYNESLKAGNAFFGQKHSFRRR
jgi:arylsulfatase A-like enzyme